MDKKHKQKKVHKNTHKKTYKNTYNKKLEDALRLETGASVSLSGKGARAALAGSAIKAFQLRIGLPATGRLNRVTRQRLLARHRLRSVMKAVGTADRLPNTVSMDEEERFYFYLRAIGGQKEGSPLIADLRQPGRRVILGLRVETPTRANKGQGLYDDRIVIMWRDMGFHVREFEATTDPSSRYEDGYKYAAKGKETKNDANPSKDDKSQNRGDLGRLPYGAYKFARSTYKKTKDALRPVDDVKAERDTNHDGRFDAKTDVVTNKKALNAGRSILFHAGGNNITGSAACQTMPPAIFNNFWKHLGDVQHMFHYLLMPADAAFTNQLVVSNSLLGMLLYWDDEQDDYLDDAF